MERRKALATAVAAATTLGIGTVCFAAIGGAQIFGLGQTETAMMTPVTELETITRVVVVRSADGSVVTDPAGVPVTVLQPVTISRLVTPSPAKAAASAAPAAPAAAPTTGTTTPEPTSATTTTPRVVSTTTTARPTTTTIRSTTTVRATTTTAKPTSTTTTIPGVPKDWPVGKPIPPMPPGCQQPQLELNGVWNCG
jgi:hypothetical protein